MAQAKKIKEIFGLCDLKAVVLHWDGKLMMDVYEHEMKDNLPVVITSGEIEQIVGVPRLDDSTGRSQAEAIYEVLADWGLLDSIKAICCDTTGTNLVETAKEVSSPASPDDTKTAIPGAMQIDDASNDTNEVDTNATETVSADRTFKIVTRKRKNASPEKIIFKPSKRQTLIKNWLSQPVPTENAFSPL
uniref:Uncharacterized protein n=1 Tax=Trichogramma kaykai TaxID=54128 RepID=A0ABD2W5V6_9HYME